MSDGGDSPLLDPAERQIIAAMEAGEFADLPGAGRPLPDIDEPYEAGWWARRWLERQRRSDAADELRRLIRAELPRLRASRDRRQALRRVGEINALVHQVNSGLPDDEHIEEIALD